jgi:hypothetical protein
MGGGQKNPLILRCVDSFKRFCPDYEITEWNESNFDVERYPLVKAALADRNWALAADVVRLWAVCAHGGIYLDTDAEIIKPLDGLLDCRAFIGYENKIWLNPATFGAVPNHEFIKKCLDRYDNIDDKISFHSNPLTVHHYGAVAKRHFGLKLNGKRASLDCGLEVYPEDWFCPENYMSGKLNLTENSHVVHHYTGTWFSKKQKAGARFAKTCRRIFGGRVFWLFEKAVAGGYLRALRAEENRAAKRIEESAALND